VNKKKNKKKGYAPKDEGKRVQYQVHRMGEVEVLITVLLESSVATE